jgi:hypothetical protein
LDPLVAHDLDTVTPGIVEIEEWAGQDLHAGFLERAAHGLLVIDDEPEVAARARGLALPLLQCKELIA